MTDFWLESEVGLQTYMQRRRIGTQLRYLWVQQVTDSGRMRTRRVPGEFNLADHLTKGKSWYQIENLIQSGGGRVTVPEQLSKR